MSAADGKVAQAIRDRLAEAGAESVEAMVTAFREGLVVTKTVSAPVTCRDCGKTRRYNVEVPDARAAASVVEAWINQGLGRPGVDTAAEAAGEKVTFHRTIVYEGANGGDDGASVIKTAIDLCETHTVAEIRQWLLGLQASLAVREARQKENTK